MDRVGNLDVIRLLPGCSGRSKKLNNSLNVFSRPRTISFRRCSGSSCSVGITEDPLIAEIKGDEYLEGYWLERHSLVTLAQTLGLANANALPAADLGAVQRVRLLTQVYSAQVDRAATHGCLSYLQDVVFPLIEPLAQMEWRGAKLDRDGLAELASRLRKSLSVQVLENKSDRVLLDYANRLLDVADKNDSVHPVWRQLGTRTGRITARVVPSVHRKLRRYITSPDGNGQFSIDIKSAEFLIAALLSGDVELLRVCSDEDFYISLGASVFPDMFDANDLSALRDGSADIPMIKAKYKDVRDSVFKKMALGMLYGQSARTASSETDLRVTHVELIQRRFKKKFHVLHAFLDREVERGCTDREIHLANGLRINLKGLDRMVARCRNNLVQGTCSDLFTRILLDCLRMAGRFDAQVLFALHDGLLVQAPIDQMIECADYFQQLFVREFQRQFPESPIRSDWFTITINAATTGTTTSPPAPERIKV